MQRSELAKILGIPDLPKHLKQVDEVMERAVDTDSADIKKPTHRLIHAKGKRLRPALLLACASLNGKEITSADIQAAAAVELVHIASLVHDDVIDKADVRWGAPTINAQEGPDHAIVIGDYLFTKAIMTASAVSPEAGQIVSETIIALCDGQSRELADRFNKDRTVESYLKCIQGKTAALFATSCRLGAMSANMSNKEIEALASYGQNFGMVFQIKDDILDLTSDLKRTGKSAGKDVQEGVYTLPLLLALKNQNSHSHGFNKLITKSQIDQAREYVQKYAGDAKESIDLVKGQNSSFIKFLEMVADVAK